MKTFEDIVKEIKHNKGIAEMVIGEDSDPRTLTTKIGQKKRAKQNIEDLFLEYRDHVRQNAVFILTEGKNADSFIELAEKDFGCFSVNARELYEKISDEIHSRHYNGVSTAPNLFDMIMSVFNNYCDQIGIVGYPFLTFGSKYSRRLNNKDDLINLIKESFHDLVGSQIIGLYAVDVVAKKAIEEGYGGTTIPIILHTGDKDLTDRLKTALLEVNKNVFVVNTSKKQTEKTVQDKLLDIRNKINN